MTKGLKEDHRRFFHGSHRDTFRPDSDGRRISAPAGRKNSLAWKTPGRFLFPRQAGFLLFSSDNQPSCQPHPDPDPVADQQEIIPIAYPGAIGRSDPIARPLGRAGNSSCGTAASPQECSSLIRTGEQTERTCEKQGGGCQPNPRGSIPFHAWTPVCRYTAGRGFRMSAAHCAESGIPW